MNHFREHSRFHFASKPILQIRGVFSGMQWEVRVNDIPIIQERHGRASNFWMPINEWLHSGKNQISLHWNRIPDPKLPDQKAQTVWPSHARARLELHVFPADRAQRIEEPWWWMEWNPPPFTGSSPLITSSLEKKLSPPDSSQDSSTASASNLSFEEEISECLFQADNQKLILARSFSLPNDWPAFEWTLSDPFPTEDGALYILTRLYQELWQSLKLKQEEVVQRQLRLRDYALATRYHQLDARATTSLPEMPWKKWLMQPGFWLLPLNPDFFEVQIASDGHLGRLRDRRTGFSPLVWSDIHGTWHSLEIWHSLLHDWMIVR